MKPKAILFDMDGVLVDSFYSWLHLFNATLKHFGLKEISEEEFCEKVWGGPIDKDIKNYSKRQSVGEVADYYFSNFFKFTKFLNLFPESKDILGKLKEKGFKIGLVTNTFSKVTDEVLRYFGIAHYFDAVVSGDDVKRGKPEPDIMIEACRRIGVSPEEAFLVGDTMNDIKAGRKAGCFTVGFKIEGDTRIKKLHEILNLV